MVENDEAHCKYVWNASIYIKQTKLNFTQLNTNNVNEIRTIDVRNVYDFIMSCN